MKRLTAIILCALLLCPALFACGAQGEQTPKTTSADTIATAAPETVDIYANVPPADYGGYEFRFLVTEEGFGFWHMNSAEQNGDVLNDSVYERNRAVEDKLNIKLTETSVHYSKAPSTLSKSVLAGEDSCDCATLIAFSLMNEAAEGILCDTADFSAIDIKAPWWNGGAVDDMSILGKRYILIGYANLMFYESYYAMLANNSLIAKYALENPYDLVESGGWTIDKMHEMAAKAAEDVNGDSAMLPADDIYGLVMDDNAGQSMIVALDASPVSRTADGLPEYTSPSEHFINAYAKVLSLYTDTDSIATSGNAGYKTFDGGYESVFRQGRSLFLTDVIGTLSLYRDMEDDFSIIAMPKYDEAQTEYISPVYHGAIGICVPQTVTDTERVATVLENLAAQSYKTTRPVYYDVVLGSKLVRDERSVESLDTILDAGRFEIAYVYDWGKLRSSIQSELSQKKDNISSSFEKIAAKITADIDSTLEQFG